jgi:phosphoglycerate kinase
VKPLRTLADLELAGRTVFLRLDLNVPLKDGKITSDARIRAALPTLKHVLQAGARVAVASHLGRPKGKPNPAYSLEPVGMRLSELLAHEVILSEACHGDGVRGLLRELRPGSLILLENLRFHSEEEANDAEFARALAAPFDVYINDAFGASHRAHASIVGMVRHVKDAAAGLLLEKEVAALQRLIDSPARPFVAVVGGAKVSDKLGVLEALLSKVDTLMIGGAMAYTFLRAQGHAIGKSRFEEDKLRVAKDILQRATDRGTKLLLPSDHVAAADFAETATATHVGQPGLPENLMGLDIGPDTRRRYAEQLATAATIFWNGPMGVFEWSRFAAGTNAVADAVATARGYTVVGGGDSVAAIEAAGMADRVDHVSTGGGASLEMIQFGSLPGLDVLRRQA